MKSIVMCLYKVKTEKKIKLNEFNFKILHGIVPCKNLKKWNIRTDDKSNVCGASQTVDHFL